MSSSSSAERLEALAKQKADYLSAGDFLQLYEICPGDNISHGSYGFVKEGVEVATKRRVALKIYEKLDYDVFFHEVKALRAVSVLKQRNSVRTVVHFFGAYEYVHNDSTKLVIVMELYTGKDLLEKLKEVMSPRFAAAAAEGGGAAGHELAGAYSEFEAAAMMKKLACALLALHQAGILHR